MFLFYLHVLYVTMLFNPMWLLLRMLSHAVLWHTGFSPQSCSWTTRTLD